MKRTLLAGTVATLALSASASLAHAQQTGWYGAGELSGLPSDIATKSDGASGSDASQSATSPLMARPEDWAGFAHVGYHLDPHWRVELQGGYRAGATNPALVAPGGLCAAPLAGAICGSRDRALGAYAMIANLIFDARPDSRWFDPFFAIGAGASRFDPGPVAPADPTIQTLQMTAGGTQMGYQAVVGLAFRPRQRLHFDLTYRWMGAASLTPNGALAAFNNGRFYQDQTVSISVRYALSSPRAAIPPAPSFGLASSGGAGQFAAPSMAPHTVVVETPSNPASLAAEAQATVRQAALSASEGRGSHVVVDGHADTASAAAYNSRLSERRAKALADAMVSLGVPVSALDIRWDGDGSDAPAGADTLASR